MSGIVTVVQAQTGSGRFPRKVLLPLAGAPAILRRVERIRAARRSGLVVVATTRLPDDDVLERLCLDNGIPVYRGDSEDLLDRHLGAARAFGADWIVRIPSDCPLVDPAAIDRVLGYFLADSESWDCVSNLHPATWPDGNDVEVVSLGALETAAREATSGFDRRNTTSYLWDHPERFRAGNVVWETGLDLSSSYRFRLNDPEDYALLAAVCDELYTENPLFGIQSVLEFLERRPESLQRTGRLSATGWAVERSIPVSSTRETFGMSPPVDAT